MEATQTQASSPALSPLPGRAQWHRDLACAAWASGLLLLLSAGFVMGLHCPLGLLSSFWDIGYAPAAIALAGLLLLLLAVIGGEALLHRLRQRASLGAIGLSAAALWAGALFPLHCLHGAQGVVTALVLGVFAVWLAAPAVPRALPPARPLVRGYELPRPSPRALWIDGLERWLPIALHLSLVFALTLRERLFVVVFGLPLSAALAWSLGAREELHKVQRHATIWIERLLWLTLAWLPVAWLALTNGGAPLPLHGLAAGAIFLVLALLAFAAAAVRRTLSFRARVEPRWLVVATLALAGFAAGAHWVAPLALALNAAWLIRVQSLRWAPLALLLLLPAAAGPLQSVGWLGDLNEVTLAWLAATLMAWAALRFAETWRLKWATLAGALAVLTFGVFPELGIACTAGLLLWLLTWTPAPPSPVTAHPPRQARTMQAAAACLGMLPGAAAAFLLARSGLGSEPPLPYHGRYMIEILSRQQEWSPDSPTPTYLLCTLLTLFGLWITQSLRRTQARDPLAGMLVLATALALFLFAQNFLTPAALPLAPLIPLLPALPLLAHARAQRPIATSPESAEPLARIALLLAAAAYLLHNVFP